MRRNDVLAGYNEAYVYDGNEVVLRFNAGDLSASDQFMLVGTYLWDAAVDMLLASEEFGNSTFAVTDQQGTVRG